MMVVRFRIELFQFPLRLLKLLLLGIHMKKFAHEFEARNEDFPDNIPSDTDEQNDGRECETHGAEREQYLLHALILTRLFCPSFGRSRRFTNHVTIKDVSKMCKLSKIK